MSSQDVSRCKASCDKMKFFDCASADEQVAFNVRTFYRKGLTLLSYSGFVQSPAENQATINTVLAALADGTLHVPVEIVPLRDAANVHHRILAREVEGKLVVDVRASA